MLYKRLSSKEDIIINRNYLPTPNALVEILNAEGMWILENALVEATRINEERINFMVICGGL